MKMFKKFKIYGLLFTAFLFFSATILNSCGTKNQNQEETEQSTEEPAATEHPSGGDEHPSGGDEHPSGGDEHPTSDTTATE